MRKLTTNQLERLRGLAAASLDSKVVVDFGIEYASRDPSFDGDFIALAERLGWTSGRRWQENPAIQIATARWRADKEGT